MVTCFLKCPGGHEPSTCFFLIGHFWGLTTETFDISRVSYFWWKQGTKVNRCAKVSRLFNVLWILGCPGKFWPKRRRRQFMPRGWIFRKWNHFHDKTTHWDDENNFFKKSWGCYHVAVVQNCRSFGRFDRQLTGHKMEGGIVLNLTFLKFHNFCGY